MSITPQQAYDILEQFPDCYYYEESNGANITVETVLGEREADEDNSFSHLMMFDFRDEDDLIYEIYFYHRDNPTIELTACGQGLILKDEDLVERLVFPLGRQELIPFIK